MTLLALLLLALTILSGIFVMAIPENPMLVEERLAISVVIGVVLSAFVCVTLSLWLGFSITTVLLAPVLMIALGWAGFQLSGSGLSVWGNELAALRYRKKKELFAAAAVIVAAVIASYLIYSHALFLDSGSLKTSFEAAWGDWGFHSATAHSFVDGANIPPQNVVYTGTPLFYPFLPDFHAAMLAKVGMSVPMALELGSGIMAASALILVAALGRILSGSRLVGALAACLRVRGGR